MYIYGRGDEAEIILVLEASTGETWLMHSVAMNLSKIMVAVTVHLLRLSTLRDTEKENCCYYTKLGD
jgi:hypothetical protein